MNRLQGILVRRGYKRGFIRFTPDGAIRKGMDALHAIGHPPVFFFSPTRGGSGYCPLCGTDNIEDNIVAEALAIEAHAREGDMGRSLVSTKGEYERFLQMAFESHLPAKI